MVNIFEAYVKYGLSISKKDIKRGIKLIRVGLAQTIINYGHLNAEKIIQQYNLTSLGFEIN